jgi:hypothetical protein
MNLLLPALQFSNKPKMYHQQEFTANKKITANDHKLPTTISEKKCTGTFFL